MLASIVSRLKSAKRTCSDATPLRRLNPPCPFAGLSDDIVIAIFVRVPFISHGTTHALCHRTRDLLRSAAFREERLESGCAEHAVVVAGGYRDGTHTAECRLLTGGRWLSIAPMSGPRYSRGMLCCPRR